MLDARVIARAAQHDVVESEALYQLALFAHRAGDAEDAFSFASEAVVLATPAGYSVTLAWSHHLLAVVHYQASNFAAALEQCLRSLEIYRTTDHVVDEARILHTIAAIYQSMGDHDRAIATYEQALAVNEPLTRCDIDAMVLGNLARLLGRHGRPVDAIEVGQRARSTPREHAPALVGSVLADLAEAYMTLGDQANAVSCSRWPTTIGTAVGRRASNCRRPSSSG